MQEETFCSPTVKISLVRDTKIQKTKCHFENANKFLHVLVAFPILPLKGSMSCACFFNRTNITVFISLLWHFELAWVQKFSTSTYITKLHSKFISSSTTCMNSFFVLFVAVSASLSLMKFHSAFPAVHEHHSTTTALVSETLKENVKHWLT